MKKLQEIAVAILLVAVAGAAAHGAALFVSSRSGAALWMVAAVIVMAVVTYWALHLDESMSKAVSYIALAIVPLGLLLLVGHSSFHHVILGWNISMDLEDQAEYLVFTLVLSSEAACHAAIAWPGYAKQKASGV